MTQAEIEAVLLAAFGQCESAGVPLGMEQREILLQVLSNFIYERSLRSTNADTLASDRSESADTDNPLDELTISERQALLNFVKQETAQNRSWKVQLLNDWLQGQDSGTVQFVREQYGVQWLERIQPNHFAKYEEDATPTLQVGDRIEVANSLWEWVQDEGPCSREWFPCTVVAITGADPAAPHLDDEICCTIRFDNGMEYELQGVYDWNRYNWRWADSD
ncbi:MAG TPA: hypothetical protein V6C78_30630 [Crinalium sp.]|jgi:hypothetical protein